MSQADELLNSVTENSTPTYELAEPHIVIDTDRTVYVPDELKHIAVQFDHNIETVTFDCPRYWDEHDLSTMQVFINYMRPDRKTGQYPCTDVTVDTTDDSIMHFTWTISGNVTEVKGSISFLVCIKESDELGTLENRWSSRLNQEMNVLEGMDASGDIAKMNPDVIMAMLARLDTIESGGMNEGILPIPTTAIVGQYLRVLAVNENGQVTALDTAELRHSETLYENTVTFTETAYGVPKRYSANIWNTDSPAARMFYTTDTIRLTVDGMSKIYSVKQDSYGYVYFGNRYLSYDHIEGEGDTGDDFCVTIWPDADGSEIYFQYKCFSREPGAYRLKIEVLSSTVNSLDTTLTVSGKAADAKAVGDVLGNISSILDAINGEVL